MSQAQPQEAKSKQDPASSKQVTIPARHREPETHAVPHESTELVVVRTANVRAAGLSRQRMRAVLRLIERQLFELAVEDGAPECAPALKTMSTASTASAMETHAAMSAESPGTTTEEESDEELILAGCVLLYTTTELYTYPNGESRPVTCRVYQCEGGRIVKRYDA